MWTCKRIKINKRALLFADETLCHAVDSRKKNNKPEERRPGGFIDMALTKTERHVANKNEAEKVESQARNH